MPTKPRSGRQNEPRLKDLLGPLEAEILEIFWDRGPSFVAEIHDVLNGRRETTLAYKTVQTVCARLNDKGILEPTGEIVVRAIQYRAAMNRQQFMSNQALKATEVLLDRFGDIAVATFVDQVATDPRRLASLRALLDDVDP